MTRLEHIEWSKKRALKYVDSGDIQKAYTSMVSDLKKHKDTEMHSGIELGMMMLISGHLNIPDEMRKFIEGFN